MGGLRSGGQPQGPHDGDGAGVPFHPLAPRVGTSPAAVAVEAPEEELVTLLEGSAPPSASGVCAPWM